MRMEYYYLLLMLSMKPKGKKVTFEHITEKFERDMRIKKEEVRKIVDFLVNKKLIAFENGLYKATDKGRKFFEEKLKEVEKDLEKINKSWLVIYKSKKYYHIVKDIILEFCKDRYIGFYCLFTEKRFFRRDFRGKKIVIKNWKDLEYFINIHCIDIIPSIHKINSERPDWLVVDIDPGPKIPFSKTKEIAIETFELMKDLNLNPQIKFSGSRGFQIWSLIESFEIPKWYKPLSLKTEKRERNYFTLFSDFVRVIQREVGKKFPNLTTSSPKEKKKREDKILLDPSSMKKMGLVRAPYSIHSKTGLVSLPLNLKEVKNFNMENANIENVAKRFKRKGNEFNLKESNPQDLLELLRRYRG